MIEEILRAKLGLNASSIGPGKLNADVKRRMALCGLTEEDAYEHLLLSSQHEMDALIALVTIPETWFFRAYDSFIYLESFIRDEWMPSLTFDPRKLRILSIPCSSGEEPYSIAMTALRCGLPKNLFSIDACDVNPANLERAAVGLYSKNSFRGELQWFKSLHFKQEGLRFALEGKVKECVSFKRSNLLEMQMPLTPEWQYDIVFCRNLLIYFDEPGQKRGFEILSSLTKDGALLFLGHAEATSILPGSCFSPIQAKGSFAFRKTKASDVAKQCIPWTPTDTEKLLRVFGKEGGVRHAPKPAVKKPAPPKIAISKAPDALPPPGLENARAFADRGQMKESLELCKSYIANNKLDPEGYFLYAVILLSAKRETEAENFLNKTIFLKPDHGEALLRLAVLKEGKGDFEGAALCRRRAKKGAV